MKKLDKFTKDLILCYGIILITMSVALFLVGCSGIPETDQQLMKSIEKVLIVNRTIG